MPHFTLYALTGHWGPNPIKVAAFLEQFGFDYHVKLLDMNSTDKETGVKGADYLEVCPNGRTPALIDHKNNDFIVWESGAILQYLANKYDTEGKYGGKTPEEKAIVDEWLFFQATGLSVPQGQLFYAKTSWKGKYDEDAPKNVIRRFSDELQRVLAVFEQQLKKQTEKHGEERAWLALDRITVADFTTLAWFGLLPNYGEPLEVDLAKFPYIAKYIERCEALPAVKAVRAQIKH